VPQVNTGGNLRSSRGYDLRRIPSRWLRGIELAEVRLRKRDMKDYKRAKAGDLVRVRRPEHSPVSEEHIGLFIETQETLIGAADDPTAAFLVTRTVLVGGVLMKFNSPYWQFEVVSSPGV